MSKLVVNNEAQNGQMVLMLDNELPTRIYFWNKERQLFDKPLNFNLEVSFLLEELSEYYRAVTVEEQIDALCDIMVFAFGFGFKSGMQFKGDFLATGSYLERDLVGYVYDMLDGQPLEDCLDKLLKTCMLIIYDLNYDPSVALNEVVKHIESRVGSINEAGKWVKDKTAVTYTPNFELAFITREN